MPFAEYRGSGKLRDVDILAMDSVWDREWRNAPTDANVDYLEESPNWRLARPFVPPGARILEAGCGMAKWVRFFETRGCEAYGIDYSQVAIESSLKLWPELRLTRGDLRSMLYDDGFFDVVFALGTVEHDVAGPEAALIEMARVLRPGGVLYCTVPCYNRIRRAGVMSIEQFLVRNRTVRKLAGRGPESAFFEYLYTPREYAQILAGVGFEVLQIHPLDPKPGPYAGPGGAMRWRMMRLVHRFSPWMTAHMVAAICVKPAPGVTGG